MNAAIYARVSTTDQNCENQLRELREYCQRMNWTPVEYVDAGISGAKSSRPALNQLLKDARLRRFDVVIVWKMDRFGRSVQQLIENVRLLDQLQIRFVVPTQGIDTDQSSPTGKFLMHIFAAFAELERDLIIERTKLGVARAQRDGKHCGRPKRVFRRDEAERMREAGLSLRQIAERLEVSFMTVSRSLKPVTKAPKSSPKSALQG